MSGNVSGHSTSNNNINSASDPAATYQYQVGVRFAQIDLPDTPENNRIKRPSTRRWTHGWNALDFSNDINEDETGPEGQEGEEDLDAETQESEGAFRLNDTNVSGPVPSQQPSGLNGKETRLLTFGTPSDASNFFTVSNANQSEDVSLPSRAAKMARPSHNNAGNSARVTESVQNGKRRVEIDLVSDDDDDVATPSQRTSNTAGQHSDQSCHTASSSAGVTPSKQTASETSSAKPALRRSQATGVERRLFTTAPQATFVNIPAAIQGHHIQAQTFSPQRQVTPAQAQADRSRSVQAHPSPIQAGDLLSQQLPANNPTFTHDGRNAPRYSPPGLFVNQFHDRPTPAATMERAFLSDQARETNDPIEQRGLPIPRQAGQSAPGYPIDARTSDPFPAKAAHPSLAPGSDPYTWVRPDVGAMSQAQRVQGPANDQHGMSNHNRHFEDADDDNPPATYSRFKNQMQMQDESTKHGNQPRNAYSGGAMRPQTQQPAHSAPTPRDQGGKIVPKAADMDFQRQPSVQSSMVFVAATPQKKRSENPFAGAGVEHLRNRLMGPGHGAYPSEYQHEEQHTQSAKPNHTVRKKDIDRSDKQHLKRGAHFPAMDIADEVNEENVQLYQHTEDYDDGDEEYTPTMVKGKQRALGQGLKKPNNETVSKKPIGLVTLRIPTKAFHLFQPPKDPSVPMGVDFLSRMPLEVRQRIYGHLLKANTSIAVMHGWSQVYRRQQLDLHVSILGVSKKHNTDGNAVLYGENVFRYILRDDAQMVEFETGKKKDERTLPLKKQIDKLRYLELEVEPNRIDLTAFLAFYAALEILVKHKATKLVRLTIDLSPRLQKGVPNKKGDSKDWISQRVWFTKAQGITDVLKQLKARFVYFEIHLEENNNAQATSLRTIVDMRPEISDKEVSAELSKHSDQLKASRTLQARRALAKDSIEERLESEAYKKLDMMHTRLEQAVLKGATHMLHRGWFTELKTERQQRKPIQAGEYAVDDE